MTAREQLRALLQERILILDGAMGTMIQKLGASEEDYGFCALDGRRADPNVARVFEKLGERLPEATGLVGNNDFLTLTRPDLILHIHQQMLEAGADIIETNTFNSNAVSQSDYGLEALVYEMNFQAASLARCAADDMTSRTPDKPRFVAGVLGPTNRTLSLSPDVNDPGFRNVTFEELAATYTEAIRGLADGGADLLLIETIFDTLVAKAAIYAILSWNERGGGSSRS